MISALFLVAVLYLGYCLSAKRGQAEQPAFIEVRPLQFLLEQERPEGWSDTCTVWGVPLAQANEAELRALVYELGGLVEQHANLAEVAAAAKAPPAPSEPLHVRQRRATTAYLN